MNYQKHKDRDYSNQEFVDCELHGYYFNCNFFGSTFKNCTFNWMLVRCNLEEVKLEDPIIKRFQSLKIKTRGLELKFEDPSACKLTENNLTKNPTLIAAIMRWEGSKFDEPLRTKCLEAADRVEELSHKCWESHLGFIPKEVWDQSRHGFRNFPSILKRALRARAKL